MFSDVSVELNQTSWGGVYKSGRLTIQTFFVYRSSIEDSAAELVYW